MYRCELKHLSTLPMLKIEMDMLVGRHVLCRLVQTRYELSTKT